MNRSELVAILKETGIYTAIESIPIFTICKTGLKVYGQWLDKKSTDNLIKLSTLLKESIEKNPQIKDKILRIDKRILINYILYGAIINTPNIRQAWVELLNCNDENYGLICSEMLSKMTEKEIIFLMTFYDLSSEREKIKGHELVKEIFVGNASDEEKVLYQSLMQKGLVTLQIGCGGLGQGLSSLNFTMSPSDLRMIDYIVTNPLGTEFSKQCGFFKSRKDKQKD